MGVGAFNDFAKNLGKVGDLKHEEGMKDDIAELKSLIRGQRVESNSADSSEISVSLSAIIVETLLYGKEKKSDTDLKSQNKESGNRFRQESENEKNWKEKHYKERKKP